MRTKESPRSRRFWTKIIIVGLQLTLSAVLLYVVLGRVSLSEVARNFSKVGVEAFVVAGGLLLLQIVVGSGRLWTALVLCGAKPTLLPVVHSCWLGQLLAQTPATIVGGDAARLLVLHRAKIQISQAASAVGLDRFFGLGTLLGLCLLTLWPLSQLIENEWHRTQLYIAMAAMFCGAVVFLLLALLPSHLIGNRFIRWVIRTAAFSLSVFKSWRYGIGIVGFGFLTHIINIVVMYELARRFGANLTFLETLVVVPIPLLLAGMPFSLGGWGLREGAISVAFALLQVPADVAVSTSIAYGALFLLVSLPGALVWMLPHLSSRAASVGETVHRDDPVDKEPQ
ncbi:lysylphosphatidylglycerol synthase transmembrane domain-containing protein [Amorphus orientalis]|uniref:Uncharacterized membrane protein YbhN (UPF0104 family) n=1 Tax=Amorphus orientalis TaxID=649198 RepID=A0AAE4ATI4_9HYPH|nr:lysylphosphatidylglycerol synthase transmembrane domain-containing protein [Amorphus orientalis]MDQ0316200.1 uncharacterized membrane protein YbhN (UPF0104 family) [Amorphus orientalis]